MERETMLVEVMGGPRRIVQEVLPRNKTIPACPLCKTRFKKDDPTVLLDVVKRFAVIPKDDGDLEVALRVHVCKRCAEPIILQKQKAMDEVLNLFAELLAEDLLKELRQQKTRSRAPIGDMFR